jgi:leucine-rich repeat kinase 2
MFGINVCSLFLGMFCTTEGISDILVTGGCVELICELMEKHRKNPEFQAKALAMLQSLVKPIEDVLSILLPEIKKVMKKYPESCELQQQCCEMLYNLAKDNYAISVKLIKEGFHQLFFKIIERFEDDFVLNSAADCIYLLACEYDLKNPMLFEMCALGNTTAVSLLLQLSADVNYSEGNDTPLSVACKANNLKLVQLLLTKGVTDMHYPLTLCLENKHHHKLAGFLLKHMGHDEDGGTISLTGEHRCYMWLLLCPWGAHTHAKISHRIASLPTSRQQIVFALLVSSCQQVWNKLTCNNLVDIIRLVVRLFQ